LDLQGDAAVGAAFDDMLAGVRQARPDARLAGVLGSPMRSGGVEILVGTVRDPQWGLTLAVGLGGVWVEALADTQLHVLPVSPQEDKCMLRRAGARLRAGGRPGLCRPARPPPSCGGASAPPRRWTWTSWPR